MPPSTVYMYTVLCLLVHVLSLVTITVNYVNWIILYLVSILYISLYTESTENEKNGISVRETKRIPRNLGPPSPSPVRGTSGIDNERKHASNKLFSARNRFVLVLRPKPRIFQSLFIYFQFLWFFEWTFGTKKSCRSRLIFWCLTEIESTSEVSNYRGQCFVEWLTECETRDSHEEKKGQKVTRISVKLEKIWSLANFNFEVRIRGLYGSVRHSDPPCWIFDLFRFFLTRKFYENGQKGFDFVSRV